MNKKIGNKPEFIIIFALNIFIDLLIKRKFQINIQIIEKTMNFKGFKKNLTRMFFSFINNLKKFYKALIRNNK